MVKVYEPEFKKQIAQLHLQGESISSISKQYGVSKASINAWTKKYREECSDKNSNAEYSLNNEIAQLKHQLAEKEKAILFYKSGSILREGNHVKKLNFIVKDGSVFGVRWLLKRCHMGRNCYYRYIHGILTPSQEKRQLVQAKIT